MNAVTRTCSIAGCDGEHEARGFCSSHYQRWYKYGDPVFPFPTAEERFWARVDRSRGPESCWPWTGTRHSSGRTGYGWTGQELAHRRAYELAVGPIPDGRHIDHTCHSKAALAGECLGHDDCPHRLCVNPSHLEPVTQKVNNLRSAAPNIVTHRTGICQRGHRLEGPNLYVVPSTGAQRCRACVAIRTNAKKDAA
jgi:hypothetical protein